jgi:hypothetical protein
MPASRSPRAPGKEPFLAATNKCLALINKSHACGEATNK